MIETPEQFEERMDTIHDLIELAKEMEAMMINTLDTVKSAVQSHGRLLTKLSELTERG